MSKFIRTLTRGLAAHPRNWIVLVMIGIGMGVWASGAQFSQLRTLAEPDCIQVRLSDYNLFLLEDYQQGTDVQGKVAAGGHITLNNFSVGAGLPDSNTSNALVAGGNLSLSNGGVHGDAWYGGSLTSGSSVTFSRGTASQGRPIDFAARGAELRGLSSRLASLPLNGVTTREPWGGVMLRGTDPQVNVFDMDASIFAGAVLLSIDAPTGSLAVLNIHGASVTFTGFGHSFSGGIDQRGVLFNFPEATAITAQGYGFWGTVLAPNAHLSFTHGSFDGGIYARAMTGNAEGHLNPLNDRDICLSGPPANTPPSVALSSPADGASFTAPATLHLTASATDSDGSIARVDFFSNGTLLGTDSSAPYTWDAVNLAAGTYALTAQATDDRGAIATSATVTVIVEPSPPETPDAGTGTPDAGTGTPDAGTETPDAGSNDPDQWVPPPPVTVPPLPPPPDYSGYPVDSQGRPIISSGTRVNIVVPTTPDAISAREQCADLVSNCFDPNGRSLDACMLSAPRCTTAQPWTESSACCAEACWTAYAGLRRAGVDSISASLRVLYGHPSCMPGVDAMMGGAE